MTRAQRRTHLVIWLLLALAAIVVAAAIARELPDDQPATYTIGSV